MNAKPDPGTQKPVVDPGIPWMVGHGARIGQNGSPQAPAYSFSNAR
jgi:hypothetical protein